MGSSAILWASSVFAIAGGVLIAIAFGTNYWQQLSVDRSVLAAEKSQFEDNNINGQEVYFQRTFGLFRKCFNGVHRPPGTQTYKSPLGDDCVDINYDQEIQEEYPEVVKEYHHLRRTYIALYVVGLALCLLSVLFLIAGCGKRSGKLIIVCGILLFIAAAFVAGSIGVWHKVRIMLSNELANFGTKSVPNQEYVEYWPKIVQHSTESTWGWSYICAWVGVGCLLLGALAMCASANILMRGKKDAELLIQAQQSPVMYAPSSISYDKNMSLSPAAAYAGYNMNNYGYSPYSTYGYNPYAAYYGPYAYMQYYGYGGGTNGVQQR